MIVDEFQYIQGEEERIVAQMDSFHILKQWYTLEIVKDDGQVKYLDEWKKEFG